MSVEMQGPCRLSVYDSLRAGKHQPMILLACSLAASPLSLQARACWHCWLQDLPRVSDLNLRTSLDPGLMSFADFAASSARVQVPDTHILPCGAVTASSCMPDAMLRWAQLDTTASLPDPCTAAASAQI